MRKTAMPKSTSDARSIAAGSYGKPVRPTLLPTSPSPFGRTTRAFDANSAASPRRAGNLSINSAMISASFSNPVRRLRSTSRVVRGSPQARTAKPPMNANRRPRSNRKDWTAEAVAMPRSPFRDPVAAIPRDETGTLSKRQASQDLVESGESANGVARRRATQLLGEERPNLGMAESRPARHLRIGLHASGSPVSLANRSSPSRS